MHGFHGISAFNPLVSHSFHCNCWCLVLTFAMVTIELVYHYWKLDFVELNVREEYPFHWSYSSLPCLDPHTCHCVVHSHVSHCYVRHAGFCAVFTKTTNADPVTRSTVHVMYIYIRATRLDRYTIISCTHTHTYIERGDTINRKLKNSTFKIWYSRFKIQDSRSDIQDLRFSIRGLKFRIQDCSYRKRVLCCEWGHLWCSGGESHRCLDCHRVKKRICHEPQPLRSYRIWGDIEDCSGSLYPSLPRQYSRRISVPATRRTQSKQTTPTINK